MPLKYTHTQTQTRGALGFDEVLHLSLSTLMSDASK